MKRLVYVAGRYTAATKEEVKKNIQEAERAAKDILLRGDIPVIPHKITSFFDLDPRFSAWDKNSWLVRFAYPLMERCDVIFMTRGWQSSEGARAELEFAQMRNMTIVYEEETVRIVSVQDEGVAKDSSPV